MTGGAGARAPPLGPTFGSAFRAGRARAPRRDRRPDAASRRRHRRSHELRAPRRVDRDPTRPLRRRVRRHRRSPSRTNWRSSTRVIPRSSSADAYSFAPTLGPLDLHLLAEGRHFELHHTLGARPHTVDGVAGVAYAVWAPSARAVSVTGDFDVWNERAHPMRSLGASGVWELFVPESKAGDRYKFSVLPAHGSARHLKADPVAHAAEVPPRTASVVDVQLLRVGRRDMDGPPPRVAPVERTGVDLRGASRLLAPRPRLHRARARAGRLRGRPRLHPRGAHAGDGASLRRVVGLPGHRVLRAHAALRQPGRAAGDDRRPARPRHRRAARLGPRALPGRPVGTRPLRRHRAVRARRSPSRPAPRLGNARLQFRSARGPELPRGERAHVAARVPRRRPAGRCGGVDAVPRLLARRGSGSPTRKVAAKTSTPSSSSVCSTRASTRPSPVCSRSRRSRPRGPVSPARRRREGSASASSGTWAGCTTPSTTSPTIPCTGVTTITS